jgi:N-acetylglucosaminyldiphosphoundecaprenol N-acetyl-beta-D-mannosaminyltransferase
MAALRCSTDTNKSRITRYIPYNHHARRKAERSRRSSSLCQPAKFAHDTQQVVGLRMSAELFVSSAEVPLAVVPPTTVRRATVPSPPTATVWDLPFLCLSTAQSVDWIEALVDARAPQYVITANLHWVMLSHQLSDLSLVNARAAGLLADGQPIVWRSRLGKVALPERVAGSELIYLLAERGAARGWRFYFLGGEPSVAQECAVRLATMYPGMEIAGVESPPFRKLTAIEQGEQLARIRAAAPDILFVAFGQPKGERWIHQHFEQLGVPVCMQVGASFDFVAGVAKRAPRLFQVLGLEWFYRMMHDPKRLLPRYAANIKFLLTGR